MTLKAQICSQEVPPRVEKKNSLSPTEDRLYY